MDARSSFQQASASAHILSPRALLLERGLDGHQRVQRKICMISYHTCPLAAPGGKETGGMNVYVRELMRQLGRRGYQVDCFTRSQDAGVPHIPDTDLGPNVRVIHVVAGDEAPISKAEAWAVAPGFVAGVRAFMAAEDIHYDVYHSHYWMSGWAARELAEWRQAPIVHMFHTLGAMKDLTRREGVQAEIGPRRGVEQNIMDFSDAIVAATPIDRGHMLEQYRVDAGKIHVVPPGVDLERFRPIPMQEARVTMGMTPDHRMILFVGRPDPVKGLETLVRAMAIIIEKEPELLVDSCLCIVGGDRSDDPSDLDAEMAHIDRLRRELGIADFVTFLGSQSQDELAVSYSAAQAVVVPSRYESFGMVALEAMACGVPVIASDVGGLSALVRDGCTGYLVPYGDPEALATRLLPILDDDALRESLGMHGVAIAEGYGWPSITGRVERVYHALWSKTKSSDPESLAMAG
jgi:D-inositol-3-phosphate glycosyltransferase